MRSRNPWIPFRYPLSTTDNITNKYDFNIIIIKQAACVYSLNVNLITVSYTTNRHMSPLGHEDVVVHRLQHHVTQPAKMATCCPLCCLSSPLLDSVVIISSPAKTRITRTSTKNIMPVLDTGHLLAFPRDMLYTRGGVEVRRGREEGRGEEASGWD